MTFTQWAPWSSHILILSLRFWKNTFVVNRCWATWLCREKHSSSTCTSQTSFGILSDSDQSDITENAKCQQKNHTVLLSQDFLPPAIMDSIEFIYYTTFPDHCKPQVIVSFPPSTGLWWPWTRFSCGPKTTPGQPGPLNGIDVNVCPTLKKKKKLN